MTLARCNLAIKRYHCKKDVKGKERSKDTLPSDKKISLGRRRKLEQNEGKEERKGKQKVIVVSP
jgi:hypothetical protein